MATARAGCGPQDGSKNLGSTVLSPEQEAVIVAFRRHTPLPFDNCPYALQATIPTLNRSSLHHCLLPHGTIRLPEESDGPRGKSSTTADRLFHIDIAEIRTTEGKVRLFVTIDRTCRFAFVQLLERADIAVASGFLEAFITAILYRIHTVLTDNGIQLAALPICRKAD